MTTTTTPSPDELLTVVEVSYLQPQPCTPRQVRWACSVGALPARRLGSIWVIRRADAEAWAGPRLPGRPRKPDASSD